MRGTLFLLAIVGVILGTSHALAQPTHLQACPALTREYFADGAIKKTVDEFTTHDLETQYEIYICGMQYLHPPLASLAGAFASQGKTAVEFLRSKLNRASDERTILDIVRVFADMKVLKSYDVSSDKALVQLIEAKVSPVRNRVWEDTFEILMRILRDP